MDNNELMHYGVLGMKWGVRRTEAQLARAQGRVDKLKAKKKEADRLERAKNKLNKLTAEEANLKSYLKKGNKSESSEKHGKSSKSSEETKPKKKSVKEMSDDELRAKINRMDLEKRYNELNTQKVKKGESTTKQILKNAAKNVGGQVAVFTMGWAVNKVGNVIFKDPAMVNPKKGQKDK